ncbi:MAG: pilus assembly FimT family protein [Oligoflexus sp.]
MWSKHGKSKTQQQGFSLIELLLVIATIGMIFVLAVPNMNILSSTEAAQKMGTLTGDIRAAFDMAVLHRRPHRLVFHFATGDYWLETTDRRDFFLGTEAIDRDLSPEELKDQIVLFKDQFEEFVELAGIEVDDIENDRTIPPTSPVLKAKERLQPVEWRRVEDAEWSQRSLGPHFVIQSMQAEHHREKITLEEFEDRAFAYLYFLPHGYVERAVIYVAPSDGNGRVDPAELPYTITTDPYGGIAQIETGYLEVDIRETAQRR